MSTVSLVVRPSPLFGLSKRRWRPPHPALTWLYSQALRFSLFCREFREQQDPAATGWAKSPA